MFVAVIFIVILIVFLIVRGGFNVITSIIGNIAKAVLLIVIWLFERLFSKTTIMIVLVVIAVKWLIG